MSGYSGYFAQAYVSTPASTTLINASCVIDPIFSLQGSAGHQQVSIWIGLVAPSGDFIQTGIACTGVSTTWYSFSEAFKAGGGGPIATNDVVHNSANKYATLSYGSGNNSWGAYMGGSGGPDDQQAVISVPVGTGSNQFNAGAGYWQLWCVNEVDALDSTLHADWFASGSTFKFQSISMTRSTSPYNVPIAASDWTHLNSGNLAGSAFADWMDISVVDGYNLSFATS